MSGTATNGRAGTPVPADGAHGVTRPTTKRTKRSWSRITTQLPTEGKNVAYTFWPDPHGLHRRRKGSPNVRTLTWAEVQGAMNGDRFKFDYDERHYELWYAEDGLHVLRCGHEEHVVKWPSFIEFVDGQKLLPI